MACWTMDHRNRWFSQWNLIGSAKDLIHSGRERRAAEMDVVERRAVACHGRPWGSPWIPHGVAENGEITREKWPFREYERRWCWSFIDISGAQISIPFSDCWNILVSLNDISFMFTRNSVAPRICLFCPRKLAEMNRGHEELLSGIDQQNDDC